MHDGVDEVHVYYRGSQASVHVAVLLEIIAVVCAVAGGQEQRGSGFSSLRESKSRANRGQEPKGNNLREKQNNGVCATEWSADRETYS